MQVKDRLLHLSARLVNDFDDVRPRSVISNLAKVEQWLANTAHYLRQAGLSA